jgi:hypothetical protein
LQDPRDWHDAGSGQRAPAYVAPSTYVQQVGAPSGDDAGLAWTTDAGSTWRRVARIAQPLHGEPWVAGDPRDPLAIQPIQVGTSSDGTQIVQLVDLLHLAAPAATNRYPSMLGFGSLGVAPTAFAWYEVLAVDPQNPAHAIAPDASDNDVKVTFDGADSWRAIPGLRALVSWRGRYAMGLRANDRVATLVSAVSFCPDDSSNVLIGTRAGGAYFSSDGGAQWLPIPNSASIAYATSVFWLRRCRGAWISTYARGVWDVTLPESAPSPTVSPAPLSVARAALRPRIGPSIEITSATIEEGERVLDPHDALAVTITNVPSAGSFVLALDGRAIATVASGLLKMTYSSTPSFWPVGHHAVSLVDVSKTPPATLWSTDFIVP